MAFIDKELNAASEKINDKSLDENIEDASKSQTKKSREELQARGVDAPTHSEIAKDDSDHPLFTLSSGLAQKADEAIGKAMQEAWAAGNSDADTVKKVTDLVDTYVSDPGRNDWWKAPLTGALGSGGK